MRSKRALRAKAIKVKTTFFLLLIILMGSPVQGQHNQNEILSRDVLEKIAGEISGKIAFFLGRRLKEHSCADFASSYRWGR